MRKIHRGSSPAEGEPLSAGRVEYLEAARQRARSRRLRRGAIIVALALPFTAFITFILMGWQGVTANLMSLGGLALALGMVVDASIVVTENVARLLSERAGQKVL